MKGHFMGCIAAIPLEYPLQKSYTGLGNSDAGMDRHNTVVFGNYTLS
jgi:hypothetical protein